MFASYSKRGRSLSTTDVYRLGEDDDEDALRGASFSRTLARKQIRRPTSRPPPPPQRSDSFGASSGDTSTLTRVRSYLSDDIRQKFESTAKSSVEQCSPSSSNFVKKLVATLERRQKDGDETSDERRIFRKASFRGLLLGRQARTASLVSPRSILRSRDDATPLSPPPSPIVDFSARISHLGELHEAENEDDDDDDDYDDYDDDAKEQEETCLEDSDCWDPDDYFSDMWPARPLQHELPVICGYPANPVDCPSSSGRPKFGSKPNSGRRSLIKNVFSSLANWKIGGKGLPKGSRDYYAARESLGEEMRAFRRDTMPRLMEHAAHNSQLLSNSELLLGSERPRRDTQDFAKLIPRSAGAQIQQQQQPSPRSLATIHPIYKASSHQLHAAVKPPPSPPPVRRQQQQQQQQPRPSTMTTTISPDEQLLLRPSRMRELQKRLSREIDSLAGVQFRSSAQYDVPRSNRPVAVVREYPHYQNVPSPVSQDKRLSCNLFTTF